MIFKAVNNFLVTHKQRIITWLIISFIYSCWVIWLKNYWLFFGILILFDLIITRFVNWRFWNKKKPSGTKQKLLIELIDSVVIAVVAVIFIKTFFFEAFTTPTSSMEKTINAGDYIFVSKLHYGPRLPLTPVSLPFAHNVLPFTQIRQSYISKIALPFNRLKGISSIHNFDIVVFNYPEGDTVIKEMPGKNYYQVCRQYGADYVKKNYNLIYRPIDKRDYYVKRIVGMPGDTLQIKHGRTFINGLPEPLALTQQYNYVIKASGKDSDTLIFNKLGVSLYDVSFNQYNSIYSLPLTKNMYRTIHDSAYFKAIVRYENIDPTSVRNQIFPWNMRYRWTEDNFGTIVVPKAGKTIDISIENISLYQRIITAYEGNSLSVKNDTIYLNNNIATSYTFKSNYYFMLGDNRHNSNDSRYWGFVPENHIIGKVTMIWLSVDKNKKWPDNIRWNKMFKFIR